MDEPRPRYPDCSTCGHNASGIIGGPERGRCTAITPLPPGDPRGLASYCGCECPRDPIIRAWISAAPRVGAAAMGARIPALTLWRPWPTLILHAGKDVENRGWSTSYRGPLYLHAGQKWDDTAPAGLYGVSRWQVGEGGMVEELEISPDPDRHPMGIVGVVQLVGVCANTVDEFAYCGCGPWAIPGQYHWRLDNPEPLPEPIACRGRQGLWYPDLNGATE